MPAPHPDAPGSSDSAKDSGVLSQVALAGATKAPNLRFLLAHPTHLFACGFGSGLAPIAPGTFGTLFGWASFVLLAQVFTPLALLGIIVVGFVFGIYACHRTGRDLGVVDHGSIVWDEIVPFWLVLLLTPAGWIWQLGAFMTFRFFDITKPAPASYFDQKVKNGFGVMMDDLVAAFYTLLCLAVVQQVLNWLGKA